MAVVFGNEATFSNELPFLNEDISETEIKLRNQKNPLQ